MTTIWVLMLFASIGNSSLTGSLGKESSVVMPVFDSYYQSQDECKSSLKKTLEKITYSPNVIGLCVEGFKKQ